MDIRITARENIKTLFGILDRKLGDMSPIMSHVADVLLYSVRKNFDAGGRPRWESLSESTKTVRKRKGQWPGSILVQIGRLRDSIVTAHGKDWASVGTNVKYAKTQQFGAARGEFGTQTARIQQHRRKLKSGKAIPVREHTREVTTPWGDVPARPFLVVQDEDWTEIEDILLGWLDS
jgi:phage virion morphogenesis protein